VADAEPVKELKAEAKLEAAPLLEVLLVVVGMGVEELQGEREGVRAGEALALPLALPAVELDGLLLCEGLGVEVWERLAVGVRGQAATRREPASARYSRPLLASKAACCTRPSVAPVPAPSAWVLVPSCPAMVVTRPVGEMARSR
jgi:hypothetical protein